MYLNIKDTIKVWQSHGVSFQRSEVWRLELKQMSEAFLRICTSVKGDAS